MGIGGSQAEWEPSRRMLDSVYQQRRTLWKVPDMNLQTEGSIATRTQLTLLRPETGDITVPVGRAVTFTVQVRGKELLLDVTAPH